MKVTFDNFQGPLSEQTKQRIKDIDIQVPVADLYTFEQKRARFFVLTRNPTWNNLTNENCFLITLNYEIKLDYVFNLREMIKDYKEANKIEDPKTEEYNELVQRSIMNGEMFNEINNIVPNVVGRNTRLHLAAMKGDLDEVSRLIEMGIDASILNASSMTAMDVASFYGHKSVANFLRYNNIKGK